jgi:hypothetical protein
MMKRIDPTLPVETLMLMDDGCARASSRIG